MVAGMVVPMVVALVLMLVMFLDLTSLIPAKSCHALWSQWCIRPFYHFSGMFYNNNHDAWWSWQLTTLLRGGPSIDITEKLPPSELPPLITKIEVWEKQYYQRYLSIPILETISETKQQPKQNHEIYAKQKAIVFFQSEKSFKNICFFQISSEVSDLMPLMPSFLLLNHFPTAFGPPCSLKGSRISLPSYLVEFCTISTENLHKVCENQKSHQSIPW